MWCRKVSTITDTRWNLTDLAPFLNRRIQLLILTFTQPRAIGVAEQKQAFRPLEEVLVTHGLEVLSEVLGLLSRQVSTSRSLQPLPLLPGRPGFLDSRPVVAAVLLVVVQGEFLRDVRHRWNTSRAREEGGAYQTVERRGCSGQPYEGQAPTCLAAMDLLHCCDGGLASRQVVPDGMPTPHAGRRLILFTEIALLNVGTSSMRPPSYKGPQDSPSSLIPLSLLSTNHRHLPLSLSHAHAPWPTT